MEPPKLREHLNRLYPDRTVVAVEPLAPDTGATAGATAKAAGYGLPVRVTLADEAGDTLELVWRVASANPFGHDRRADRAGAMILAYDDFAQISRNVEAVDVGAIRPDGELVSIRGEPYLITTYARGSIYADDLRRAARDGVRELDIARADALARHAAALHVPIYAPDSYRRAVRDLVGHGEGIYGIVDGYPEAVPGAPAQRLRELERRCADWRWRLRGREARLTRTHGDFHPFNVVFRDDVDFTLLDASRGTCGDPADDVTAMMINYVLFAFEDPAAWTRGLSRLWHRFWMVYLHARPDEGLFDAAPPWFAWRALVVCNPVFYPRLGEAARDRLLGFAERALDDAHLDPLAADRLFSDAARHAA
jgi:hypothetical protein